MTFDKRLCVSIACFLILVWVGVGAACNYGFWNLVVVIFLRPEEVGAANPLNGATDSRWLLVSGLGYAIGYVGAIIGATKEIWWLRNIAFGESMLPKMT